MPDKRTALKKGIITTLAVTLACRAVSWLNWMLFKKAGFSRTCITLLLLLFLFGPVVTPESEAASPVKLTPEERSWLDTNREKLILLYNIEFPPIEFKSDSGTFIGMGADVIARIEEMLGVTFIKKPSDDWNKHLAALKSGECAIAPTIVRTVEREEYAFFTAPYATVPVVIITTNAISGRLTLNDFTGRRVGVVSGYATENVPARPGFAQPLCGKARWKCP